MIEVLGSGDHVLGDEQGLEDEGLVPCGADLLEHREGAGCGVMAGGIGPDDGERLSGVLIQPAELARDHAAELPVAHWLGCGDLASLLGPFAAPRQSQAARGRTRSAISAPVSVMAIDRS